MRACIWIGAIIRIGDAGAACGRRGREGEGEGDRERLEADDSVAVRRTSPRFTAEGATSVPMAQPTTAALSHVAQGGSHGTAAGGCSHCLIAVVMALASSAMACRPTR